MDAQHSSLEPEPKLKHGAQSEASPEVTAERALMLRIYGKWNGEIVKATRSSSVSAAFLAALTANESGGDPAAQAFEPGIFERLLAVMKGEQPAFGSITAADLVRMAQQGSGALEPNSTLRTTQETKQSAEVSPALQKRVLRQMATSWGLTQIMGYQTINRKETVQVLLDPLSHYELAVELLEEFSRRFHLNPSKDAESMFRCWNTGRPDGKTSDPDYVPQGIQRLRLYSAIAQAASSGQRKDYV
ncbi:MAG TPA: hypothetical protein VMI06_15640 [Terriglobia bacterium]|nr:hypothetical protein [Terriglobia bacterium]